jgi:hypothetical protein
MQTAPLSIPSVATSAAGVCTTSGADVCNTVLTPAPEFPSCAVTTVVKNGVPGTFPEYVHTYVTDMPPGIVPPSAGTGPPTSVTPPESVSGASTSTAEASPVFVTVRVTRKLCPTFAGFGYPTIMVADNAAGVCTVVAIVRLTTIGTTPQVRPAAVIVNVTVPDEAAVYRHSKVVPELAGIVSVLNGHETGVTLAEPGFT